MEMIKHGSTVESFFGYWPEFCDGKLRSFSYIAPAEIRLVISYMDADKSLAASVELKFDGVSDVELSELRSENVIDSLTIRDMSPVQVSLDACYGLSGSFKCKAVEVVSLLPNNSLQARRP